MIVCYSNIRNLINSFCYCFLKWKIYSIKLVNGHNSWGTSEEHPLMVICNCPRASSHCCSSKLLEVQKQLWIIVIFVNIGCTSDILNNQQPLSISSNIHCFQMKRRTEYGLVVLKINSIIFVYIKCLIISDKSQDMIVTWNVTAIWCLVVAGNN